MDKVYNHQKYEKAIYQKWEAGFAPNEGRAGEASFCIIMPPPNANGELHLGHATFVAVSDALIRYFRMKGSPTLWLPGVDHAGILSQVTFEKKLAKEGKSRFDLGREEFVKQCYEFCMDNKHLMESQLKALGASCDWSREKFTLDPAISKLVYGTFIKMHQEGLIYRGYRIVNWCPRCRSTLSDVELEWEERDDKLYFVRYPMKNKSKRGNGDKDWVVVATTRVEPIWVDTHLAVNPKDRKNKQLIGNRVSNPLTGEEMEIIGDEFVDPEFGTGVVKLTPAHDAADFEVAEKRNLPIKNGVDFDGKLTKDAGEWAGMKTAEARKKIAEFLEKKGLLEKAVPYRHQVAVCERCGTVIEPLVSRQWFVKIKPLAEKAIAAAEEGRVKIVPRKYEKMYFNWMHNIKDWPISRQLWWGHQLPVWYRREEQKTEEQAREFELLKSGDTRARTDVLEAPVVAIRRPETEGEWIQDPDTFDTWFSSGQWPVNTLKTSGEKDWERFYPTSVMNTAYEILFLWVARMIMFGLHLTGEVPFRVALINGVLRDETGAKMSKSRGNGVNPNEAIEKYGADAVRMALVAGRDNGNDLLISKQQMEERIKGYRNFSNKLWNLGRYIKSIEEMEESDARQAAEHEDDKEITKEFEGVKAGVGKNIEKFRLGQATEELYDFVWHKFANVYVEKTKGRKVEASPTLKGVYGGCLKLLHPFMPFVTEAIWQEMDFGKREEIREKMLMETAWPE